MYLAQLCLAFLACAVCGMHRIRAAASRRPILRRAMGSDRVFCDVRQHAKKTSASVRRFACVVYLMRHVGRRFGSRFECQSWESVGKLCVASGSYDGMCSPAMDFEAYTSADKLQWGSLCAANWYQKLHLSLCCAAAEARGMVQAVRGMRSAPLVCLGLAAPGRQNLLVVSDDMHVGILLGRVFFVGKFSRSDRPQQQASSAEGMSFVRLLLLLVLGVGVECRAPPGEKIRSMLRGASTHVARCVWEERLIAISCQKVSCGQRSQTRLLQLDRNLWTSTSVKPNRL